MAFDAIKKILPSKKVLITIVSIIVLILVLFLGSKYKKAASTKVDQEFGATIPAVPAEVLKQAFDVDTDQDGISDWEESLWATDPKQKDTDGDGISDGAFILAQRARMRETMPPDISLPQSESEVFDRQFFATIAYLEQSGELTEERKKSLSDIYTTYVMQPINVGMTREDIKIVSDDQINMRNYLLQIDDFLAKNELIPSQMAEFMQSVRFGSVSDELYGSIVIPYGRMIDTLKNMPVPEKFVNNHLALLNAVAIFKVGVLDGLGKVADEPVYALRAVAQFKDAGQAVIDAVTSLQQTLSTLAY